MTMWLPRWRSILNPWHSSTRRTSCPDNTGSLGNLYLHRGNIGLAGQALAHFLTGSAFKEQFHRFLQIRFGFLYCSSLRSHIHFRTECDESAILAG